MKNNLENQIIQLISEQLRCEQVKQINLQDGLQDLGLDSLDLVELVIKLEDLFRQEISDQAANNFVRVADIVSYFSMT
jgi:acyl carrier protein